MPNYEKPKTSPEELKEVEEKKVISYDSKSIFEKMSDKAKKIASAVYEGVYQMPVANRIVGKIESFNKEKARWEQLLQETELRHQNIEQRLKELEDKKTHLEELYKKMGWSERKIKHVESTKEIEKYVTGKRKQLHLERESIEKEILKNQKKISKLETKVNPYLDKKQAFVRVTERQKIDYKVKKRERGTKEEETREEEIREEEIREEGIEEEEVETEEKLGMEEEKEKVFEKEPEFALKEVINKWNNYLKEEHSDAFKTYGIDELIFAKESGLKLDKNFKISEWNRLMKEYLNLYQQVDEEKINNFIKDFNKKLSLGMEEEKEKVFEKEPEFA
ncbi:MAG TPA: hypothetical protein PK119_02560, partial [Candidatus Paceibacterota bacterium]|nr:hypothetical protein [Candidatus Paceibacterota bacterium]